MEKTTGTKEEMKMPDGVQISLKGTLVTVQGPKGTLSKTLAHPNITLAVEGNTVQMSCPQKPHKKERALLGTFKAQIRNMVTGVTEGYECTMKTVFSHFPIKSSVDGSHLLIQNFLGERHPRSADILENVKVEVKGETITITGIDKEKVGQTAANIERATRVKNRDVRVFQDGIYIVKKG